VRTVLSITSACCGVRSSMRILAISGGYIAAMGALFGCYIGGRRWERHRDRDVRIDKAEQAQASRHAQTEFENKNKPT
jgi:hypothetical protein